MDFKKNTIKPILFMVFNRPELTARVWERIRLAKPEKLYISSDGPRVERPEDITKVEAVRKIVEHVDWACDVKYLIHEQNLGCTMAGKTAFDWVFSQEQEMIQMEDDVLPTQSFFWFIQEMLEKYKDDQRIAYVCSENFGIKSGDCTYFYTKFGTSGGWATWKRVYDLWEYKLDSLESIVNTPMFRNSFPSKFQYEFWKKRFFKWKYQGGNTYDLQNVYLVHKYNMLNIVPNINLNTNIGWDGEAKDRDSIEPNNPIALKFGNRPSFEIENIHHPLKVSSSDKEIGEKWFKYHFQGDRSALNYRLRWFLANPSLRIFKTILKPVYTMVKKKVY